MRFLFDESIASDQIVCVLTARENTTILGEYNLLDVGHLAYVTHGDDGTRHVARYETPLAHVVHGRHGTRVHELAERTVRIVAALERRPRKTVSMTTSTATATAIIAVVTRRRIVAAYLAIRVASREHRSAARVVTWVCYY